MKALPYFPMAKKKEAPKEQPKVEPKEPTELEAIEAEMRQISPRLPDLRKNASPDEYTKVYTRYMWLVQRRTELLK